MNGEQGKDQDVKKTAKKNIPKDKEPVIIDDSNIKRSVIMELTA